jgi:hypothetical protein
MLPESQTNITDSLTLSCYTHALRYPTDIFHCHNCNLFIIPGRIFNIFWIASCTVLKRSIPTKRNRPLCWHVLYMQAEHLFLFENNTFRNSKKVQAVGKRTGLCEKQENPLNMSKYQVPSSHFPSLNYTDNKIIKLKLNYYYYRILLTAMFPKPRLNVKVNFKE